MAQDRFYVFDKLTKKRTLLGEIQSDFNMSFTIDGTKDSCSVIVWSFIDYEIEPYTICWHEKTNTWWVVSHDKIERYQNENGFLYTHEIELLGAVELLNARDLTDCGFNDNTYTVRQFIERLFKLSNCEFNLTFDTSINQNFLSKNVDFIKTFENYTLLSALREFLDAYNMCPKLSFYTGYSNNDVYLAYAGLEIISKTGDNTLETHTIEYFDNVRETKTMDKNSFGTIVVSNAENVISSKEKRFPSTGSVKVTSTQFNITSANAVLRLPSKVFKGISLTAHIPLTFGKFGDVERIGLTVFPDNYKSVQTFIDEFLTYVQANTSSSEYAAFLIDFNSKKDQAIENMRKASCITFYEGNNIDPTYDDGKGRIIKGENVPYLASLFDGNELPRESRAVIFTDKASKETLPKPYQGIAWERGSDLITGFEGLANFTVTSLMSTDYQVENNVFYSYRVGVQTFRWELWRPEQMQTASIYQPLTVRSTTWSIVYIPMSDIKVKVDNQRDKKDIQLYNQNGRITDGVALSKLLNSYSKEISSDNIVRYMQFTNYNDIPKVGSFVIKNGEQYVINNVSLTFVQNETTFSNNFGYYIDCEFNMSKAVSTKSLLVNPNSNIRDYGIPQNFNVKRKQLYRDYYELNYGTNSDTETDYYLDASNIFTFGHENTLKRDLVGIIKIGYDEQVEGQDYWYYQLETTNYYMNKMFYVMLDFKDNNIIGYGSQNVFSGFDITKVLTPGSYLQTLNTPISYVDVKGKLKSLNILLCNNEQLTTVYQEYREESAVAQDDGTIDLYNYSVFIPSDIFEKAYTENEYSIQLNEQNYNKDALEVPVFEYGCQIEDTIDVLIGNDIMTQRDGNIKYFYSFVKGRNLNQNNAVQTNRVTESISPLGWTLSNGAAIEYDRLSNGTRLLRARIYTTQFLDSNDGSWNDQNQLTFEKGYDYAFFRHTYDFTTKEETIDLLFIAKAIPNTHIGRGGTILILEINHYKLN